MKKQAKIFILLSILIACACCFFVWINYHSSKRVLQKNHDQIGVQLKGAFQAAFSATETRMLQISTFVSYDPRVQQLFLKGKLAVLDEGGGAGGEKAANIRQELYTLVAPSRDILAEQFQFRQLHFHLGPGSLSFLRSHKPTKFGDQMNDFRHTIVAANNERVPITGFETGRISSGIRGISPIFATDLNSGEKIHLGAVEAGTSFSTMISSLKENEKANFAVLLTLKHLEENIYPDVFKDLLQMNPPVNNYMIEATTSPSIRKIIDEGFVSPAGGSSDIVSNQYLDGKYAIMGFPLRDFIGTRDGSLPDVGMVLAWWDISQEKAAANRNLVLNIIIAVFFFCFMEAIMFFGIRTSSKKLIDIIEADKVDLEKEVALRVKIKKELLLSEKKFRTMANFSYDWEVWHGPEGEYRYISPSCERITGYAKEAFWEDPDFFMSIVHSDDQDHVQKHRRFHFNRSFEQSEMTFRIITRKGDTRWIWHQCQAVIGEDGEWLGRRTTNRDVTQLTETERRLRDSESLLKQTQKLSKIGHWNLSIQNNEIYWSKEIYSILNLDPHHAQASHENFLEAIHPDDIERVNLAYSESSSTKKPYNIENRLIVTDGEEKWIHQRGIIQYDQKGTPVRSLGVIQDITNRKKQEETRFLLNQQDEDLKRFKSLKTMAGAIAHRFNNAMMIVQGSLEMINTILPENSQEHEMVLDALQASKGASQVGSNMLSYVGQQNADFQKYSLAAIAKETLDSLEKTFPQSMSIQFLEPAGPLYCSVDQKQIRAVMESIVTNAVESTTDTTGKIEISFSTDTLSSASFPISFQNREGREGTYVCCQIKDTGHGISADNLPLIFEPFHTTRFFGRGLGLALTVGIMRTHYGAITVESTPGVGTTVKILLPSI